MNFKGFMFEMTNFWDFQSSKSVVKNFWGSKTLEGLMEECKGADPEGQWVKALSNHNLFFLKKMYILRNHYDCTSQVSQKFLGS